TIGRREIRFKKFFEEIDRVAGGLYALGIRRGDVCMTVLPNILQHVVLVYALSRIGAVVAVVHPLMTEAGFKDLYNLQKPKAVFLSDINFIKLGKIAKDSKTVFCSYVVYSYTGLPNSKYFEPYDGDGQEPAFYMHSGGTTGAPKTVVLSSKAVNALARNILEAFDGKHNEDCAMLVTLPLFHGFGMCVGVHASLCSNMKVVLLPSFSGKRALKAIVKNKVTDMIAVPRMLVKLLRQDGFEGKNIASLRDIYVGGDSINPSVIQQFNLRMEQAKSKGKLHSGYGLTEVGSCVAVEHHGYKSGTVGRMLPNMEALVATENCAPQRNGEVGELLIGGDQLMTCYLGDDKLTREVFCEIDGKRYLKTGDYFSQDDDGFLTYKGRKKRLIKISGVNVFPLEIERVAKELPFVGECVAYEVKKDGKTFSRLAVEGELTDTQKSQIEARIKAQLTHWHIPSGIDCVAKLPRTDIGKI
ncbi:MAG: class I adenylate-forming enzyme family protein, partial [Clostridia bacterium]